MRHDWYDPRYEEPKDPEPTTQTERWQRDSKAHRRCRNCRVLQKLELSDYDRLQGSTYRWSPKVGRCTPAPRVGDVVRTWYDNGLKHGMTIILGYVIAAGPKFYRVRWRSGMERRVERADPKGVEHTVDPLLVETAEKEFKRAGIETPKRRVPCT